MGATGISAVLSQFSAGALSFKLAHLTWLAPGGICHSFLVGDSCGMMNKKQLVTLSQLYHISVSVSLWVSLVRDGFLMPSPLFPLEYTLKKNMKFHKTPSKSAKELIRFTVESLAPISHIPKALGFVNTVHRRSYDGVI